ncbi:hypothetical protein [Sulfuriroseicoccus oceanibius]|uniref:Uncharacterized protein n=1 Tax=Sulfuriroseicoccus oceanibius TaxID=2707525 RepID=A0A6B3L9N5_9BACT|nr:hypothetical protein [Sulfuriroseicoccus oceanibius]QQL44115.1 hypothetical protein G3M56_009430 [Sulfuriroseicoccus oceanibius]
MKTTYIARTGAVMTALIFGISSLVVLPHNATAANPTPEGVAKSISESKKDGEKALEELAAALEEQNVPEDQRKNILQATEALMAARNAEVKATCRLVALWRGHENDPTKVPEDLDFFVQWLTTYGGRYRASLDHAPAATRNLARFVGDREEIEKALKERSEDEFRMVTKDDFDAYQETTKRRQRVLEEMPQALADMENEEFKKLLVEATVDWDIKTKELEKAVRPLFNACFSHVEVAPDRLKLVLERCIAKAVVRPEDPAESILSYFATLRLRALDQEALRKEQEEATTPK